MTLHAKRMLVAVNDYITLHFNGWDVAGKIENVTSNHLIKLNGKYYSLRACTSLSGDVGLDVGIAAYNRGEV